MDMAEGEYDSTLEVEDELTFQEIENFRDIGGYRYYFKTLSKVTNTLSPQMIQLTSLEL
jgi:hypothetical protein